MNRQESTAQPHSAEPASQPGLRRELRFMETTSVSVGVMAPTLAMSVTGVAAAGELGRAAPLAFAVAALGVGLVAYGFVRLAGEFSHAGSVYAFVGQHPRPPAGVPGRMGAARHVPGVPAGVDHGRGHLRAGLPEHHGAGSRRRLVPAGAGRVGGHLGARGSRGPADDQVGPGVRGRLGLPHPRAHGRDLLAAGGRDRAPWPGLVRRGVRAPARGRPLRPDPGRDGGLPGLRGLRVGRLAGGRVPPAQAHDPSRHRHRGRLRCRLLRGLHYRPDARVRHRRGRSVRLPPFPGTPG